MSINVVSMRSANDLIHKLEVNRGLRKSEVEIEYKGCKVKLKKDIYGRSYLKFEENCDEKDIKVIFNILDDIPNNYKDPVLHSAVKKLIKGSKEYTPTIISLLQLRKYI